MEYIFTDDGTDLMSSRVGILPIVARIIESIEKGNIKVTNVYLAQPEATIHHIVLSKCKIIALGSIR